MNRNDTSSYTILGFNILGFQVFFPAEFVYLSSRKRKPLSSQSGNLFSSLNALIHSVWFWMNISPAEDTFNKALPFVSSPNVDKQTHLSSFAWTFRPPEKLIYRLSRYAIKLLVCLKSETKTIFCLRFVEPREWKTSFLRERKMTHVDLYALFVDFHQNKKAKSEYLSFHLLATRRKTFSSMKERANILSCKCVMNSCDWWFIFFVTATTQPAGLQTSCYLHFTIPLNCPSNLLWASRHHQHKRFDIKAVVNGQKRRKKIERNSHKDQ